MASGAPVAVTLTVPVTSIVPFGVHQPDVFTCAQALVNSSQITTPGVPQNVPVQPAGTPTTPISFTSGAQSTTGISYSCLYTIPAPQAPCIVLNNQTSLLNNTFTTSAAGTRITSAQPAGTSSSTNDGVSTAAAAGIAIGATVAGILIEAAAMWFCFFLRRHRRGRSPAPSMSDSTKSRKSMPTSSAPSLNGPGLLPGGLHHYLLDGVGDSDITAELVSVGHLLKDHVQAHYHKTPLGREHLPHIMNALSGLGLEDAIQSRIATAALDERTRHVAIRSLLARVIFSALDMQCVGHLSLLPPQVTAFVTAMPMDTRIQQTSQEINALASWRRLSTYLLHKDRLDRLPLPVPASIEGQIRDLHDALDGFLSIFVPKDGSGRARTSQAKSLERAIRACAKFGYAVFSHPCEWRYLFGTGAELGNGLVVLPGLERWSGPDGEMYKAGHLVVRPMTEGI